MEAQVGFNELDPNILWVADSTIGCIDGFAVHPNGNVFAYRGSNIYEIDGSNGKLIRQLPKLSKDDDVASFDLSKDGKYLAISYEDVVIIDLSDLSTKVIGKGNPVKFTSDSRKVAFGPQSPAKPFEGSDSNIVIVNLENGERRYVKDSESLTNLAFSPDGRFFATGGSGQDMVGKSYVSLKLWDANTLKLIKELAKYKNHDSQMPKVQFSKESKKVAFYGTMGIIIFDTDNYNTIKHYTTSGIGMNISRFAFISEELLGIQSEKTTIFRLSDDSRTEIYEFPRRCFMMETNITNDVLFAGTGYPALGGSIIAWDLKKVFSDVNNEPAVPELQIQYNKGRIQVQNLQFSSPEIKFRIINLEGLLIKELNIPNTGNEFTIPVRLSNGTYILHVKDGSKEYSSKFLVTE